VPHVKPWPSWFFITLAAASVSYLGRGIFCTGALNIIWALRRYNQAVAPALTHGKKPDTATAWQSRPALPHQFRPVIHRACLRAVAARERSSSTPPHHYRVLALHPRRASPPTPPVQAAALALARAARRRSIHYHGSALCFRLQSYTAAWAAPPFTYHRLASGPGESIWLLTIAPSRDSSALVRCSMEEVALSAAEADVGSGAGYEAVSHRWSQGRAWVPVEVDGAQLGVTGG
jgi:hypothetical protein